jgi:hypothetical protein
MNLSSIHIERVFNLGNYESIRLGLELALDDQDSPELAFEEGKKMVDKAFAEHWAQGSKLSRPVSAAPTPDPDPVEQAFNEYVGDEPGARTPPTPVEPDVDSEWRCLAKQKAAILRLRQGIAKVPGALAAADAEALTVAGTSYPTMDEAAAGRAIAALSAKLNLLLKK